MKVLYVDSFFDFKDFDEDPVHHFIDEPTSLQFDADREKILTVSVQKAKTELLDDYFMMWLKTAFYFAKVGKVKTTEARHAPGAAGKVTARVRVVLDSQIMVYGRVADTIFSGLEAVGGFYESLMHIGILFVFFFQERLFKSSFLR